VGARNCDGDCYGHRDSDWITVVHANNAVEHADDHDW
jgi:hypothetical protein